MIRFIFGLCLIALVTPVVLLARRQAKKGDYYSPTGFTIGAFASAALGVLLALWSAVRVVPANSVGIPTKFGSIGQSLNSGFHLTAPWTSIHTFSTRIQESSMLTTKDDSEKGQDDSIEVRGADGYLMNVGVTVRYFILPDHASALFKLVGSEFGVQDRLVRPEVREAVRVAFSKYTAEEGYASKREVIRAAVLADLTDRLARYGLKLDSVAIRDVEPDPVLSEAISQRAAAREKALQAQIDQQRQETEAQTRLEVAKTDAEAKKVAAQAEAASNEIITESLSPELLELKRIEALEKANTVYVPSDSNILVGPK